ncbi:hypothetical protein ACCO45_011467 [Purpureocillium lilacinum]|uniref:Uncharacterized protein n=1 Tax=Purpureocillium lilacinum TaxID=33203 RepID=A0ACC4DB86_PURLI
MCPGAPGEPDLNRSQVEEWPIFSLVKRSQYRKARRTRLSFPSPDEDLIDYDSDDASPTVAVAKKSSNEDTLAVNAPHEVVGDSNSPVASGIGTEPALAANGTHISRDNEDDAMMDQAAIGEEDSHGESDSVAVRDAKGGEEEQADVHEIDYDHDDCIGRNGAPAPSRAEGIQDTSAIGMPEPEDQAEHFEIDWEEPDADGDEEASDGAVTHSTSEQQATEPAEPADAVENGPSSAAEGSVDGHDYNETSSHELLGQGRLNPGNSLRFIELRSMLDDEIGEQDELVLQVDKLGLEFAESSPSAVLSTVTLHKVLDLMDSLVKNEDPESYTQLYTYLFTRPDTLKRFKFLQDSATVDKKGARRCVDDAEELDKQESLTQEGLAGNDAFVGVVGEFGEDFFGADEVTNPQEFAPAAAMGHGTEKDIEAEEATGDLATTDMMDAPLPGHNTTIDLERDQGPLTGVSGAHATESKVEDLFEAPELETREANAVGAQAPHVDEDLIEYTDDKIETAGEDSITGDRVLPNWPEDFSTTKSAGLQQVGSAAVGGGLVDDNAGNDDAIIQVNALRSDDDLGDYNDQNPSENSITGMKPGTAQVAANTLAAPGSRDTTDDVHAEQVPNASGLKTAARHIRSTSDISISFSEAGPDQVPPALTEGASPSLQIFNLDDAAASGTELLETESEAAALLESEVLDADLPNDQDDLSEIDWAAEEDDGVGGGLDEAQATAVKRSLPDDDAYDGNDVKRHRPT